jgi:hypothetical protein
MILLIGVTSVAALTISSPSSAREDRESRDVDHGKQNAMGARHGIEVKRYGEDDARSPREHLTVFVPYQLGPTTVTGKVEWHQHDRRVKGCVRLWWSYPPYYPLGPIGERNCGKLRKTWFAVTTHHLCDHWPNAGFFFTKGQFYNTRGKLIGELMTEAKFVRPPDC